MLSEKMLNGLNDQITKELFSSYLYLQMSAWLQAHNLPGFATWMKVQAQEEIAHAMIFFNYVNERGGFVEMGAIDKPEISFEKPLDIAKKTLEHEQFVTASIENLMDMAVAEKDYATRTRLEWFISEQVEEESNANDLIAKFEMVGDGNGLYMMDKELSTRIYVTPSPLATA